ncbi:MAG: DUF3465 domain-containing protein [Deltaproteobacteria bacterium]|nr:DUF3465 domain-containing protein [Deltaproteobacteria bacterium]
MRRRFPIKGVLYLVIGLVLYGLNNYRTAGPSPSSPPSAENTNLGGRENRGDREGHGDQAILDAFREHRSGVVVEASGIVSRKLPDDLEGSRHQKFILRLADGHTVLVSHNIDLSERVPIATGDTVELRGQYEWSDRGGVIHWTHHDPQGHRPGGWILHRERVYR